MDKLKEDLEGHIGLFETRWQASRLKAIQGDLVKKEQLTTMTFVDKAMNWFTQYGLAHFLTYDD